jgi:MFS family permease
MLSLMFGTGIISRLSFGWIADRIGPAPALIISSSRQAASLMAYFGANGLTSLYVVTAMFGLVQGGIVPTYALIVRECYPPSEAGSRIGLVLSSTLARGRDAACPLRAAALASCRELSGIGV